MNFFFLVQAALLSIAVASFDADGDGLPLDNRTALCVFGLILAILWGLVAASSYWWIRAWRGQLVRSHQQLGELTTGLQLPASVFEREGHQPWWNRPMWFVRPTSWTIGLPLAFAVAWIYLAFIV